MEILRNMWRRKFRTFLTVCGIAVGMFAFTVMGSMALRFNKMISGGKDYITGQITILPKGTSFTTAGSGAMLPVDTLNRMADVEGVEGVAAMVEMPLKEVDPDDPTAGAASFGVPPTIEGIDLDSTYRNKNWAVMPMREGKMLEKGDPQDNVVIGVSIATDNDWKNGDRVTIRGREFTVQGIIDQTLTGPDSYVFMHIRPARELLIESNPFLKSLKEASDNSVTLTPAELARLPAEAREQLEAAKAFNVDDITVAAGVSWEEGQDPEVVVERIKEQFKDEALVLSPKKLGEQIDSVSAIFNAVILGSAMIALVVGGFSIINTMVMAISERTKEIGIKKAVGASRRSIAGEYTLEAGVIGLLGGLVGLGLGMLTIILINGQTASSGAQIFLVETWFLGAVIAFSFVLGIIAGIIPAWRAARLKAVDAIREL